jgi:hypothetical protein
MDPRYTIDYRRNYFFPLERPELWTVANLVGMYERWWPWMRDVCLYGTEIDEGSSLEFVIATPLPYKMRVAVDFERVIPGEEIHARVRGDLDGTAHVLLTDAESGTVASLFWRVELKQRGMRTMTRFARPIVRKSHDWAVAIALRGFRDHLSRLGERPA